MYYKDWLVDRLMGISIYIHRSLTFKCTYCPTCLGIKQKAGQNVYQIILRQHFLKQQMTENRLDYNLICAGDFDHKRKKNDYTSICYWLYTHMHISCIGISNTHNVWSKVCWETDSQVVTRSYLMAYATLNKVLNINTDRHY